MYLHRTLAAMALALFAASAAAQDYPSKAIRIVVSFTAGGTTDVIARKIAERLTVLWKQPVVIENKPGAGGTLGTDYVVSQAPDGYTLLMSSSGPIAISPSLSKKLATDPFTAIVPVILVADVSNVLVTSPETQIRTVEDLIKRAKAAPGTVNYGSTGVGTVAHLAAAQFSYNVGMDTVHVPYKGAGAVTDLMAGRLQFMFATLPSVVGQIKGGKLVAIGQVAGARAKALPDVPTMKELGYAGMENGSWFGLFAPKGTPQAIVDKLNAQVNEILKEKETQEHFERNGAEPAGGSAQDFARFIRREYELWRPVVARTGATAD